MVRRASPYFFLISSSSLTMTLRSFFSEPRIDSYSVDAVANFGQLLQDFVDREPGQAMQLQFEDGVGLHRVERTREVVGAMPFSDSRLAGLRRFAFRHVDRLAGEILDQVGAGIGAVFAAANDADDVVHAIERNLVALEDVLAVARLQQQVGGAAAHHVDAVIDEVLDGLHQAHFFRLAVDHGQEDHAEALLHRGVLEELVEHDLRLAAALQLDDDAHAVAVALVADVADLVDDLVVHQFGDALDQLRLVHLVGNLGDDDRVFVLGDVLDGGLGAHHEAAAAGAIGLGDAAAPVDEAAGREVGALHELQHVGERGVRIVHQRDAGVDDLGQIVRRNLGRHADGDSVGAVHQQVGNARRQHQRLDRGVVEVGDEIDGVFVDVGQQLLGDLGHARFGVPVGRRRIAIDRAEVALSIDQRIAQRERLRHAHHRVVHRGVAVRMILAQHFADDLGALHVLAVVQQSHVVHRVKNAAMHRLQAVAHVGQRAPDDDRHRIVEIRTPHLFFNVDGLNVAAAGRGREVIAGLDRQPCCVYQPSARSLQLFRRETAWQWSSQRSRNSVDRRPRERVPRSRVNRLKYQEKMPVENHL